MGEGGLEYVGEGGLECVGEEGVELVSIIVAINFSI